MMNRRFVHPATLFFLLTLVVALLSWVGSIYGWEGVQSLISADGVRWLLRNAVPGFLHAPLLGPLLVLAFGAGLWMHSRLGRLFMRLCVRKERILRKEKRALCWSLASGVACLVVGVVLAWGPWGIVRSITGGLEYSPLADGAVFLLSVGMGIMAMVYGYATDYYHTDRDLVLGLSYGFVRFSAYFISLFFVVQLFSSLHYSGLDTCFGLSPSAYRYSYMGCALLVLFGSK